MALIAQDMLPGLSPWHHQVICGAVRAGGKIRHILSRTDVALLSVTLKSAFAALGQNLPSIVACEVIPFLPLFVIQISNQ